MSVLAAGYHLHPASDGTWLCAAPGDRFVRLSGPPHVVKILQEWAHSGRPVTVDPGSGDADLMRQLVALLEDRGILAQEQAPAPAAGTLSVLIDGDNPIADAVAALISDCSDVRVGVADEASVADSDIVVSCAQWLPDAHWSTLQTWCAASNTAWQRCHAEGAQFFVGPFWTPGSDTADYIDVRSRRLAASGVADHLLEHWAYLDDPGSITPPVHWPTPAGIALVAAAVASDVIAYSESGRTPGTSVQLEIEPSSLRIVHHSVLPIPFRGSARGR